MDLRFNQEQDHFRLEVRGWLEENAPSARFGRKPLASLDTARGFEQHREWERRLFDARLSVVSWPGRESGAAPGLPGVPALSAAAALAVRGLAVRGLAGGYSTVRRPGAREAP